MPMTATPLCSHSNNSSQLLLPIFSSFILGSITGCYLYYQLTCKEKENKKDNPVKPNDIEKNTVPVTTIKSTCSSASSSSGIVMVAQRCRSASILKISTDGNTHEILSFGEKKPLDAPLEPSSSSTTAGMIVYISFAKNANEVMIFNAAKTLINLPILTLGHWGEQQKKDIDVGATASILQLATYFHKNYDSNDKFHRLSLVIVPQANIISKTKNYGKSIQYHDQISKSKAQEFYQKFIYYLTLLCVEHQFITKSKIPNPILPATLRNEINLVTGVTNTSASIPSCTINSKSNNNNPNKKEKLPDHIPPHEMFRNNDLYTSWDDKGFPLTLANGEDLNKNMIKKLKKAYESQKKRYDKYLIAKRNDSGLATNEEQINIRQEDAQLPELRDDFIRIIQGSFGKRQGLEFSSDMGPFCHIVHISK